jgi:hypothetical protein
MTRRQEFIRPAVAVAVFASALVLISRCQAAGFDERTQTLIDENDSLRTQVAVRGALERASARRVVILQAEKKAAQDSARTARGEADRLRAIRHGTTPARPAQPNVAPPATVPAPLELAAALENCEAETVALRAELEQDSVAFVKSALTEAEHAGQLASKDSSIVALGGQVGKLERQLLAADPPCRVVFLSCPSRTQVAVGSAIGTALLLRLVFR